MRTVLVALLLGISLAACAGDPRSVADMTRQGASDAAIDGYSPVSYFTQGAPLRGSAEFAVEHDGVTYWLANADEQTAFKSDPARYIPAHGGWCSLMLSGSGQLTPANPESFKIVDGKLLLFWSGEFNAMAIDGRANWDAKITDDASELARLRDANKTWQKLLAGGKEKVVLFVPGDAERVSAERRAGAKKRYE